MLLKCKICGGDLIRTTEPGIYQCSYCRTQQTTPEEKNGADDRISNLFNAANQFLKHSEFDRAEKMFEEIIKLDNTEAEAYWGLIRCRYGVEYVYDSAKSTYIPTCHRTVWDPIVSSPEYLSVIQYTNGYKQGIYQTEAAVIDKIQKNILKVVQSETPFDVFICYKETDDRGTRTEDSVIANALYHTLTKDKLKVFYAPITLVDKVGQQYEPYIYAALSTAKVMLVVGTKKEYFEAPWVRNEWGRFMKIMNQDRTKLLIPCYKNMNPYLDLPDEFKHFQGEDIGDNTITFIQKIAPRVKKICTPEPIATTVVEKTIIKEVVQQQPTVITTANGDNINALIRRMNILLEDGDFTKADECCEKILNINPESAEAYLGKIMIEYKIRRVEDLPTQSYLFFNSIHYPKLMMYGSEELKSKIESYATEWKNRVYNLAIDYANQKNYDDAIYTLTLIEGWKDSKELIVEYKRRIYQIQSEKQAEKNREEAIRAKENKRKALKSCLIISAIVIFLSICLSISAYAAEDLESTFIYAIMPPVTYIAFIITNTKTSGYAKKMINIFTILTLSISILLSIFTEITLIEFGEPTYSFWGILLTGTIALVKRKISKE